MMEVSWDEIKGKIKHAYDEIDSAYEKHVVSAVDKVKERPLLNTAVKMSLSAIPIIGPNLRDLYDNIGGERKSEEEKAKQILEFLQKLEQQNIEHFDRIAHDLETNQNLIIDAMNENRIVITDLISHSSIEILEQLRSVKDDTRAIRVGIEQMQQEHERSVSSRLNRPPKPSIFLGESKIFVGRKQDIDTIKNYFVESNLPVSITGEGGIGKSELAYKAMHKCEDMFDLIIPIYFGSILTFESFLLEMAKSLNLPIDEFEKKGLEERRQIIIDTLGQGEFKHPLIYADNYETISGALTSDNSPSDDAIKINSFLENVPLNITILLTSRQRNNLDGERPVRLDGLNETEGRDLFIELAKNHFTVEPSIEMMEALEEISRKTGGHPLAIELLARRYRGEGLSEIKTMLKQLGVGVINKKEEVERLRSLESCFEYSFRALAKMHQDLFPRLTIFNSPFPASAVEAIFGYDKIDDVLLDLYDYSLLRRIEFDSYGMPEINCRLYHFHPVVRQYAQQKANHYALKLEEEYGEEFSKYYYRMIYETYNSWNKENRNSRLMCFDVIIEGENNDIIRSAALTRDPRLAAYILRIAGIILMQEFKFNAAFILCQKALTIDQRHNDEVSVAKDYEHMGTILYSLGKLEEALVCKNNSLEIYRKFGIKSRMALVYQSIAMILRDMNKFNDALIYHAKALELSRELSNKLLFMSVTYNSTGFTLRMAGEVEKDRRRLEDSLTCHNNALNIYYQLGKDKYLHYVATAYMGLGLTYRSIAEIEKDSSKLSEAQQYLEESLAIQLQLKNQDGIARLYNNIGLVLYTAGQFEKDVTKLDRSIIFYSKALDIHIAYDDKVGMVRAYNNISKALYTAGQLEKDVTKLKKAEDYRKKALDAQAKIFSLNLQIK